MPIPATQPITPQIVAELRAIVGRSYVVADADELLVYECDAYTLEKYLPSVVVLPRSA